MSPEKINFMGMDLEKWVNKSCTAEFGVGEDWATLYYIESKQRRNGHATELLIAARDHYVGAGKRFAGSVALNDTMRRIYQKLGIEEYA